MWTVVFEPWDVDVCFQGSLHVHQGSMVFLLSDDGKCHDDMSNQTSADSFSFKVSG